MDIKDFIINHSVGNLYWKDSNGRYLGCNLAFAEIAGLEFTKDIIGKTDRDLFFLKTGEEGVERIADFDRQVIESGRPRTEEEVGLNKEGEEAIYLSKKIPMRDDDNEIIGVVGTSLDITREKALEQAKTEFVRNMEHDIRTPFVGIYGVISLLKDQEVCAEKKEILEEVSLCAKELLDYCDDILQLSKSKIDANPVISKPFVLRDLMESVMVIEKVAARNKNLSLQCFYDEDIPKIIFSDEYRLKRILLNLIGNSIKFTEKGGIEISVSLVKKEKNRMLVVRLDVKDSGIGISEENQKIVFERFSKVPSSNTGLYKGLGLGLSFVKQFVNDMDGDIFLKSEEGVGSMFSILLPVKESLTDQFIV